MKNYLLFIVDSLNYSYVKKRYEQLMPFCHQISRESITCDNMFSQAPYTEAAVMNIYCGQNVLDNDGYLLRFKNSKTTIFEQMKAAGYKTYYNSYQPQCYPSSLKRGVDEIFFSIGFDLSALWSYRISHYSSLLKDNRLTEQDYVVIEDIIEDNIKEWIDFLEKYINQDSSCDIIYGKGESCSPQEVLTQLKDEYDAFVSSRRKYVQSVLINGRNHRLFTIPAFILDKKVSDRVFLKARKKMYKPLARKIRKKDFFCNLRNNKGFSRGMFRKFVGFIKKPNGQTLKDFLKSAQFSANVLFDLDLNQRVNKSSNIFKAAPSAKTHVDHYLNWASKVENEGHFACIHIDDVHNPEMFFTYDSDDVDLIKQEFEQANKLIDSLPSNYKGSVTHDLSLRYIDSIIEYMFSKLKDKGLLDKTCIIITADHGFSFSANPMRDTFVTNLFLENYNIPCVVYNSGEESCCLKELRSSKDIPATICQLALGNVPEGFSGHSLISDEKHSRLYIEYCGGGCPDLTRRDIKLAAFNEDFFVGTLCDLNRDITQNDITEVYDLKNDPQQKNNLFKTNVVDCDAVNGLFESIKVRRQEIICQIKQ